MRHSAPTINGLLLTILFCTISWQATHATPTKEQEDALKKYYKSCLQQLHSPDVLKMCDTLNSRALEIGSNYYILQSVIGRLDYYYFQNDKDKIPEYIDQAKRLARQYDEPELYYFVWGSRQITFYLKNGMVNHALLEAQNMLREAEAEACQKGIIECYKAMGNIYTIQSSPKLAADYYRKLIDLVELYDPEDVNLPVYYSMLSEREINCDHLDEAEKTLNKIEAYYAKADTITPYQQLSITTSRMQLYNKKRDQAGVQKSYEQIENLFSRHKDLAIYASSLLQARLSYYMNTLQYDNAIAVIDSIGQGKPSTEMKIFLLGKKGDISRFKNDHTTAAQCYWDYISLTDSVRRVSMQNTASEIAGLMNVQQLEKEKQQLQVDLQQRRLRTTSWILILLGLALVTGTVFMIRLFRLNRHFKEAKRVVQLRNCELQEAKERAEEASNMKSLFIQNISHEVRTPLNAIVGFSQVISELCDQPETREYSSIIAANSDHLLRLFNDMLELSSLDQLDKLSYNVTADIDASCQEAIDLVSLLVKKEVKLNFRPTKNKLQIRTNPTYVTRILGSLLHNAAKFTESGSITLRYEVSRMEGVIRYSVTDTGSGIPIEKRDHVFKRFRKLDSFSQGSGLGLAVSRTIAAKLDGTLELDKEYTSGCRFVLTLPLQTPESVTK